MSRPGTLTFPVRGSDGERRDEAGETMPVSLRGTVTAWSAVFAALTLAVSCALAVTTTWQRESTDVVLGGTSSVAIADQLAVHLLVHSRLSHLRIVTRDPSLTDARRVQEVETHALVERARSHVGSAREREVLVRVERGLDAVFEERAVIEREDAPLDEAMRRIAGPLDRAQHAISELRALNQAEVDAAHEAARRIDDLATAAGIAAAATLLLAVALLLVGLRRLVLRPLGRLRIAIDRARRGDRGVRADALGPQEIVEIARAWNQATAALERQHDDRLAFL